MVAVFAEKNVTMKEVRIYGLLFLQILPIALDFMLKMW